MKNFNTKLICTDRAACPKRENYVKSVDSCLKKWYEDCFETRRKYALSTSIEQRYHEFIKMHGFPLTEYDKYSGNYMAFNKELYHSDEYCDYYKVVSNPFEGVEHYGILMLPKGFDENKKYPLVIFNHGANDGPEMVGSLFGFSFNYNHSALRFIEKGIVVYAPQMMTWNPNAGYEAFYERARYDKELKQMGGSFTAFELLIVRRIIDYFCAQSYVDAQKIGYAGLSWGGMYALHAGATDSRIKAVLSSCFFNDRRIFNWDDWSYKNQANTFFDSEVASLVLPRFLAIESGQEDPLFVKESALKELENLKFYAKNFDCEDKLFFNLFKGEHEYNPEQDTIDWFVEKLLNGKVE